MKLILDNHKTKAIIILLGFILVLIILALSFFLANNYFNPLPKDFKNQKTNQSIENLVEEEIEKEFEILKIRDLDSEFQDLESALQDLSLDSLLK